MSLHAIGGRPEVLPMFEESEVSEDLCSLFSEKDSFFMSSTFDKLYMFF